MIRASKRSILSSREAPAEVRGGIKAVGDFLRRVPLSANIIDLGCGDGHLTRILAESSHRVLGVGFSHEALRVAKSDGLGQFEYRHINMNNRADLLTLGYFLLQTREPWYVFSNNTLHGLTRESRENVFLFLRQVLRGGAFAYFTTYTSPGRNLSRGDPRTWCLPRVRMEQEASLADIEVEALSTGTRWANFHKRRTATSVLRVRPRGLSPELLEIY